MNNNTTLKEAALTFTLYKNEAEKDTVLNLIEDGAYTSIIALEKGWVCEAEHLDIHQNAIEESL
jgi:hypothetical protein